MRHDSFAINDAELGETDLIEHAINTGANPVKAFPRILPYALRKELEEVLRVLLAMGCIEPSTSPYVSGLVLVRKKDGSLRVRLHQSTGETLFYLLYSRRTDLPTAWDLTVLVPQFPVVGSDIG